MADNQPRDIEVHWREEDYLEPSASFLKQANLTDPQVYDKMSLANFPDCFRPLCRVVGLV